MNKPNPELADPELVDDENPEWTDEMFARARPAAEVLGAAFMAKACRGRPKGRSVEQANGLATDRRNGVMIKQVSRRRTG